MDATSLRVFIYDWIVSHGAPPTSVEIGERMGVPADVAKQEVASLNIGKTVLRHPVSGEIWMAGPFAAGRTSYRVHGARVSWWANCAWDALGIAAIVHEKVIIEGACADCGEPMRIRASHRDGVQGSGIIHLLLPVRDWYRDIGYT